MCPQHDLLYDNVTCVEHLEIFGAIKGVDPRMLPTVATELIGQVGLQGKETNRSST